MVFSLCFPPIEHPDPVTNCSSKLEDRFSVTIKCAPGGDGGLVQVFHMEAYVMPARTLLVNRSAETPHFTVKGLQHDVEYRFVVYASNPKGFSDNISMDVFMGEKALAGTSCKYSFYLHC